MLFLLDFMMPSIKEPNRCNHKSNNRKNYFIYDIDLLVLDFLWYIYNRVLRFKPIASIKEKISLFTLLRTSKRKRMCTCYILMGQISCLVAVASWYQNGEWEVEKRKSPIKLSMIHLKEWFRLERNKDILLSF